jgi:toxin-antitoxin system PIN domain toxin
VTFLLDANVLIALVVDEHVHHGPAERWMLGTNDRFATCPQTQGSLVRLLVREGQTAKTAAEVVRAIDKHQRHEFWVDDVSYADVSLSGVIGHRQVTDAYLAELARRHGGGLVTFDEGLAQLHSDVAQLLSIL